MTLPQEIFNKAHDILLNLVNDEATIRALLTRANINIAGINFAGGTFAVWSNILSFADKNNQVKALLLETQKLYPGNTKLQEVIKAVEEEEFTLTQKIDNYKNYSQLTFQEKGTLINALLKCPFLENPQRRQHIIGELPNRIKNNISHDAVTRIHINNIINTLIQYLGGLEEFIAILMSFEGESSLCIKEVKKVFDALPAS